MPKELFLRCIALVVAGVLTLLFAMLKWFSFIDWSWGWVASPIWITYSSFLLELGWFGVMEIFRR